VHEGNAATACSDSRSLIDQAITRLLAGVERPIEVGHPIADVMDSRPPALQKFCDGTGGIQGGKELDRALSERQRDDGGTVGDLGGMGHETEDVAIKGECRLEIRHGDTDVSDPGLVGHRFKVIRNRGRTMSTNGNITHVSDTSFGAEVETEAGLVLVDFWAEWCGPCRAIAPILEQLATSYAGRVKVTKLDVDANQRTSMRFNVRSIPTLLFFKDGKHVDTVVGLTQKPALEARIQKHLAA
jgi:thioredoxin 1